MHFFICLTSVSSFLDDGGQCAKCCQDNNMILNHFTERAYRIKSFILLKDFDKLDSHFNV